MASALFLFRLHHTVLHTEQLRKIMFDIFPLLYWATKLQMNKNELMRYKSFEMQTSTAVSNCGASPERP